MSKVVHRTPESLAGFEDVVACERTFALAALGEQIAAEKGARGRFHQQTTLPRMWNMWGIEPAKLTTARTEFLTVSQRAWRSVREITDARHCRNLAAERHGMRC